MNVTRSLLLSICNFLSVVFYISYFTLFLFLQSPSGLCSSTSIDQVVTRREMLCGEFNRYTLFFLHFQKCGGTSVEFALKEYADRCDFGYSRFPKRWRENLQKGKITFLTGHIFFGLHSKLPASWNYDYIAIFRDPFDRAWSHYKHNGQRRCKCSFPEFSKMHQNYYQYKLVGSRSNKLNFYLAARKALVKIELLGHLDDMDGWYSRLEDLLKNRSHLPLTLPELRSYNVRNISKVPGLDNVGSNYNQHEYNELKQSEEYDGFKLLHRNDYRILSEIKRLMEIR